MPHYNSVYSLFHFLKGGQIGQHKQTVASTLKLLTWGLISLFAVNFFVALVQMLLVRWNLITAVPSHGAVPEYLRKLPHYRIYLEIVLLAPILEECAFRGILQRRFLYFRIGIAALLYPLCCKLLDLNFYLLTIDTACILLSGILIALLFKKQLYEMMRWLNRSSVYPVLLWTSALGFGLWHYHNFDFDQANSGAIVISLLPFVLNSLILAYISLRAGLLWSIGLHMLNNAWPLLIWL